MAAAADIAHLLAAAGAAPSAAARVSRSVGRLSSVPEAVLRDEGACQALALAVRVLSPPRNGAKGAGGAPALGVADVEPFLRPLFLDHVGHDSHDVREVRRLECLDGRGAGRGLPGAGRCAAAATRGGAGPRRAPGGAAALAAFECGVLEGWGSGRLGAGCAVLGSRGARQGRRCAGSDQAPSSRPPAPSLCVCARALLPPRVALPSPATNPPAR